MLGGRMHDQRREHLLQHVPIFLENQIEEFLGVVRDQIDFQAVIDAFLLDRLFAHIETDHLIQRQQMHAAKIEVGIR